MRISRQYAETRRIYLKRHILPYFAKNRLSMIKPYMIEEWMRNLQQSGLSPSTVNVCLAILKIILKEALRLGYLSTDPSVHVGNLKEVPKPKAILSLDEVSDLFREDSLDDIWAGYLNHYALNLLAASTGMRQGEIQGLQVQHVHPDHVAIVNTWERKYGLKDHPKWGSYRVVPIPRKTSRYLSQLIEDDSSSDPSRLVFHSPINDYKPLVSTVVRKHLYRAFEVIGISPEERKRRNLTFHSWRYFFNSCLRSQRIPDSKVQRLTGHRTLEMTEHYTRFNLSDYQDVIQLQEVIFRGDMDT